jgi:hypothetical protein
MHAAARMLLNGIVPPIFGVRCMLILIETFLKSQLILRTEADIHCRQ